MGPGYLWVMMRSNTPSTLHSVLLSPLRRGIGVAALATGMICAAPSTAEAATCTEITGWTLVVDVSSDDNFFSRDEGDWVGSLDTWDIASGATGTVDVLFNFYGGGTFTVDQVDFDVNAGESMTITFDIGESYYVGMNIDPARASIPPNQLWTPPPQEPNGPLPQNEVIISPKDSCGGA